MDSGPEVSFDDDAQRVNGVVRNERALSTASNMSSTLPARTREEDETVYKVIQQGLKVRPGDRAETPDVPLIDPTRVCYFPKSFPGYDGSKAGALLRGGADIVLLARELLFDGSIDLVKRIRSMVSLNS